jgi:hypothetical protein
VTSGERDKGEAMKTKATKTEGQKTTKMKAKTEKRGKFGKWLGGGEAGGDDVGAADGEVDARKRARRRTSEDGAVFDGKKTVMAGAFEGVFVGTVENGAGVVSADAAVGDVRGFAGADEDARRGVCGVFEDFGATDRKFTSLGDHDRRR